MKKIRYSEITPEKIYYKRRSFMRSMGYGIGALTFSSIPLIDAKANNLKLLEDDGVILNSSAILCSNKNSIKKREVKKFVKLLSKN